MTHANILDRNSVVLVVVDIQEAFRAPLPDFALIADRSARAVQAFAMLGLPVIITEQYPKGLGKTAEEIMLSAPENVTIIEKSTFSAFGASEFTEALKNTGAKQVVLCGLEAHICVNQTAHDLLAAGYQVHLLQDCVSSRTTHDKHTGIKKMQASGAIPSNLEMALFELMRDSKHEQFKQIQGLIK
jgi:nicotinamidase-related amidase